MQIHVCAALQSDTILHFKMVKKRKENEDAVDVKMLMLCWAATNTLMYDTPLTKKLPAD